MNQFLKNEFKISIAILLRLAKLISMLIVGLGAKVLIEKVESFIQAVNMNMKRT